MVVSAMGLSMRDLFPDDKGTSWNPFGDEAEEIEVYPYVDEDGEVLFEVVRFELTDTTHPAYPDKSFRQRVPGKGWGRKKYDVDPVLYRLPNLLQASENADVVFVVEGEKDVHTLEKLGFTATTNPQGAGDWHPRYNPALDGAHVVVLPDNDDEGRNHARTVAGSVFEVAASVRIVDLPGIPPKGDVTDWMEEHTAADLNRLVQQTDPLDAPLEPIHDSWNGDVSSKNDAEGAGDANQRKRKSAATKAIELAKDRADFFHHERDPYARRKRDGYVFRLGSETFHHWLADLYLKKYERALNSSAFQDALMALKGQARKMERPVHIRTAGSLSERRVHLYLGGGRVVCITRDAIEVQPASEAEALFWEPQAAKPLPNPDLNGTLGDIGAALDLEGDALLVAAGWLLATLLPGGPYPVLAVYGPQGSGKSTRCKQLTRMVDPSKLLLRTQPRKEDDLIVAARSSHLLTFDNVSKMSDRFSDALCRIATGGGIAKRTLYSNDDVTVVNVKRPVIINAIVDVVSRSDLADRLMLLELERIDERRTERAVEEHFKRYRAKALGALLKGVQAALRNWEKVDLPELPRMADAAKWAEAGLQGLGAEPLAFFDAFTRSAANAQRSIIDSDLVGSLVVTIAKRGGFRGTASKLLAQMEEMAEGQRGGLPSDAAHLGTELRRIDPALRQGYGVEIDFKRTPQKRLVIINEKESRESLSSPSSPSQNEAHDSDDSHDGDMKNSFVRVEASHTDWWADKAVPTVRPWAPKLQSLLEHESGS